MPAQYGGSTKFAILPGPVREQITRCVALTAATAIREFHALISSLLASRPAWQGINIDGNAFETSLVITKSAGPETLKIASSSELRGRVRFPINCVFEAAAFSIPSLNYNKFRYLNSRNVIFHELGHCMMFKYSFDDPTDQSDYNEHLLNMFFNYDDPDWRILPFWEGWAVYFSMLLLGANDFLTTQMTRVAAKDSKILRDAELTAIAQRASTLESDLANIFASGILKTYQIHDGQAPINGLTIDQVLARPELSDAGLDKGFASEMCLAFSLYSLTRFLVERHNKQLSPVAPANGDGRIARTQAEWHEDTGVRNALWTAIFEPFLALRGNRPDTIRKFTRKISQAMRNDPDWHKIKKIFNTYHLLVTNPTISSISPSSFSAGNVVQSIMVVGDRFPDASTGAGDGGLRIEVTRASMPSQSAIVIVTDSKHVEIKAHFASPGSYTLNFLGRWNAPVARTVTVT